jgi:hypothetical protein
MKALPAANIARTILLLPAAITVVARASTSESVLWCPYRNMASQIPTALKAADLARFAMRASQLEKAKPVISYWCWTSMALGE